jgi:hypothetical protein
MGEYVPGTGLTHIFLVKETTQGVVTAIQTISIFFSYFDLILRTRHGCTSTRASSSR